MNPLRVLLVYNVAAASAMVLPAVPVVGGAVAAAAAFMRVRKSQKDREAFLSVEWAEAPDQDADGESCEILGTEPGGKTWFVCDEKSDSPDLQCEPVQETNPSFGEDKFICKSN